MVFQGLLEGVNHSFTKDFHFIDSVKAYLSYALLRASVSQSPVIFQVYLHLNFDFIRICHEKFVSDHAFFSWQYATGIFSVLLLRFRESLKVCILSWQIIAATSFYSFTIFFVIFCLFLFLTKFSFQGEIGVFFPLIVLRSLDGLECPVNQKLSVLRYVVLSDWLDITITWAYTFIYISLLSAYVGLSLCYFGSYPL